MKNNKVESSSDKTPKYTVKKVAEIMNISEHTVRYYDNEGLIPFVSRTQSNIRLFSDNDLNWIKTVHCLRATDLSIKDIKKPYYVTGHEVYKLNENERYKVLSFSKSK